MASTPVQYLTPEGRARLQSELDELTTAGRKQIADELRRAREEGDLSENFGYSETKRQQALLEGRIREIQSLLNKSEVLENTSNGRVTLGSTVEIQEPGEKPETYQLVSTAEANPRQGRISHESPLGRAILGHCAGDDIEADTPGGVLSFKILNIK
jgi:transcription elongation factor GreA